MAVNSKALDYALLEQHIADIAKNDTDALAALYRNTSSAVYSYSLSLLRNTHDAEEVLHDCYLRIHSAAPSYRADGKPMAWILTIARNLCYMRLRERQKAVDLTDEEWSALPGEGLSREDWLVLDSCLQQLSDEERQIVMLHAVAGLRHREIAQYLDKPLPTVLSKYHRAIKKLRHSMQTGE